MRNSIVGIIQTTTKATTFDDKIRSRSEPPTENRCGFSLLLLRKSPRITYPLAVYFVSSRPLLPVARALQPWLLSSPVSPSSAKTSASLRSVVRNVRSPARWCAPESYVSRSRPTPGSPSSLSLSASVAVSVPRSVHLAPLPLSTCPRTSRVRSPIDTPPTVSSSTVFPRPDPARYSVSSVRTVLARARP
ncbi:hypothetical protein F5B18DRAFT_52169 [Nemania serpens]|nr:hypothetical protein F5B18DRAFT_52169 [Nemania serpens]